MFKIISIKDKLINEVYMKIMNLCIFIAALVFLFPLNSKEIVVKTPDGESFLLDVQPEESFLNVIEQIEVVLNLPEEERKEFLESKSSLSTSEEDSEINFCLDFMPNEEYLKSYGPSPTRNYWAPLTPSETGDISYIVKTLANESLNTIRKKKKSIKAAGDRIDHVHPFNFLKCIFTDEELKVGIRNIKSRSMLWGDFVGGVKKSCNEESQKNNLRDEFIQNFAAILGIDPGLITPAIHNHRWDDFVDILISNVPRNGEDPSRYGQ